MPAVSVILPTYNRASTLRRAISSVLAQTVADLELIVVDDASTDATATVLGEIGDPRLRVLRMPVNRGPAAARNAGLAEARADWVAFQDSDDQWLISKLEAQFAVARPDSALVIGTYIALHGMKPFMVRPAAAAGGDWREDVLDGWPIITPTWLVRRERLAQVGGFDESFACLEDWDLALRLTEHGGVSATFEPTLLKHGSVDSVCADPRKLAASLQRILAAHRPRWASHPRRLARRLAHLGVLQHRLGHPEEARSNLRLARKLAPRERAPHLLLAATLGGDRALRLAQRFSQGFATMAPGK